VTRIWKDVVDLASDPRGEPLAAGHRQNQVLLAPDDQQRPRVVPEPIAEVLPGRGLFGALDPGYGEGQSGQRRLGFGCGASIGAAV
jgi:hypothetical protein